MNPVTKALYTVATATKGDPIASLIVVFLFFLTVNFIEIIIEKLLFGESFFHWFDLVLAVAFLFLAFRIVTICAVMQIGKDKS